MSELLIVRDLTPAIFTNKGVDPLLKDIREKVANFDADISTEEGRGEIKAFAYKISRLKIALDNMGKDLVSDWKNKSKLVDAERKRARDAIDKMRDAVRKPLTDWEDAEKERIEDHTLNINNLIGLGDYHLQNWQSLPVEDMQAQLNQVESFKERDWHEFSERANQVIPEAIEKIGTAIAKREAHDKEQAELEEFRKEKAEREKHEYEEKLKAEAADKARIEAEQKAKSKAEHMEREKVAAEEAKQRAEANLKAAKEKYAREAEGVVLRERERVAVEQEAKRQEELKRTANEVHRATIFEESALGLRNAAGLTADQVNMVLIAIDCDSIPHISIKY